MNLQRLNTTGILWRVPRYWIKNYCNEIKKDLHLCNLCSTLSISENQAKFLCLKQPILKKLNAENLESIVNTIYDLGYSKEVLIKDPSLFGILPVTLNFRHKVLQECGFETIHPEYLVSYLPLVRYKTIGLLKKSGVIAAHMNIENRLASYMTQWPTSLTTLVSEDVNSYSLYKLRLKIIQRYLELVLDLTKEEFDRGLQTYPTIKHRPLKAINETLQMLLFTIMMPSNKIKNNLYLIHADPNNLRDIIYKFRSIGGTDIKEILRMYPKIASKNYNTLVEIRNIIQAHGFSDEAQTKCFSIYTLSADTVRERISVAKSVPEFSVLFDHPRFLKMIFYNNTAMKRLQKSYIINKKCLSLNVLSGCSAHYETFEKAPGDRLGKGKDLLFCVSQVLGGRFKTNDIRNILKRHPFWINIPIIQVKLVYEKLSKNFSQQDIFENSCILLYPWSKIRNILKDINKQAYTQLPIYCENVSFNVLSESQKLSLIIYILEKEHYFSGNGVWTDEMSKIINEPTIQEQKKYMSI